jgi:tetratricopeptide (TPR) repeat protein
MRKLVFLLCFFPAISLAGSELDKANTLFRQTDYKKALFWVKKALKDKDARPRNLIDAYRIQGLSFAARGKTKAAVDSFRKLLAIDPEFRLSPSISPKLTPPFYQALGMAAEVKPISIGHSPLKEVEKTAGLELKAELVSNPFDLVGEVRLKYQVLGVSEGQIQVKVKGRGVLSFKFPDDLEADEIIYFFEAVNQHGGTLSVLNNKGQPFVIAKKKAPEPVFVSPVVKRKDPPIGDPAHLPKDGQDGVNGATPWYKTWWFWTTVGVVVVGAAATGTAIALSGGDSGGPYHYGIIVE